VTMGANLLLVDDDPDVVATFSRWLRLEGCEVRTASPRVEKTARPALCLRLTAVHRRRADEHLGVEALHVPGEVLRVANRGVTQP
jgi:CheY-like chemotaxis protein